MKFSKIKNKLFAALILFQAFGLGACATLQEKVENPSNKVISQDIFKDTKDKEYQRQEGSLWPGETSDNLLFADTKAKQLGDVVNIILEENLTSSNSATTETSREFDTTITAGSIFGLPTNLGITNFLGSTQEFNPNLTASVDRSNDGAGTTTRSGSVTGRMAALITEVLPNGIFRIEGRRTVTVNDEEQIMILEGLIRPVDIGFDNTISSQRIANAKITLTGEGVVSDENKVGWLTRFLAYIWPF